MNNLPARSEQNIDKLAHSYDPALVKRDLKLITDLDARMLRLQRVLDKLESAQILVRSDAFSALPGWRSPPARTRSRSTLRTKRITSPCSATP
jgi:hypothetical protein